MKENFFIHRIQKICTKNFSFIYRILTTKQKKKLTTKFSANRFKISFSEIFCLKLYCFISHSVKYNEDANNA